MLYKSSFVVIICVFIVFASPVFAADTGVLTGPYLGQPHPNNEPVLFAPGLISDAFNNRDMAIVPDGSEIYYSVNLRKFEVSTILGMYKVDGQWTDPEVPAFARDTSHKFLEPAISADGSKFFFVSSKVGANNNNDIWVMHRVGSGWGNPRKLSDNINTAVSETFPSVTQDGTLYFSRVSDNPQVEHIYRSRLVNGVYAEAEKLPVNVNSGKTQFNAFVAPDESYLIVCVYGREDSLGSVDYYIVYRNQADVWSEPINMGAKINTPDGQQYSPYVSPDGNFFFFMSSRLPVAEKFPETGYSYKYLNEIYNKPENGNSDIYWVNTKFIDELRPEGF